MKFSTKSVMFIVGIVLAEIAATHIFASVRGPRIGALMIVLFTLFIHPMLMVIVWFGLIRDSSQKRRFLSKSLCMIALILAYPLALNMGTGFFVGPLILKI
ncbi:hypothetical protein [Desmospora activa]|uniref:Uncharacterized protein n=1 Tax=Desmospora activa DSM 45169 TaxID=1121389 RepID=A0A2T4Z469_9BACL|nr:hypothetical protein [Desmospora activa]PTM56674.1 hypothetical protein C8J48_2999 [Desmospora activa DSM 45169]